MVKLNKGIAEEVAPAGGAAIDFESPGFIDDPYPHYHALRAAAPVYPSPWGDWYLTRFADVAMMLTDQRFQRQSPGGVNPVSAEVREPTVVDRMLSRWMVFRDPPAHTRLRRLASGAFTPKRVAALRRDIGTIAARLLDEALQDGACDVIADFAYPLPVIVVSRILGVPEEDFGRLKDWSRQLTAVVDASEAEGLARGIPAAEEFTAYMADLIAARRRAPADDLISAMLAAAEADPTVTEEDLLANCVFLLWAGHETTKNLIGNGVLSLIRHPREFERLVADPGLMEHAVDEFLRFECPVQKIGRWTRRDVEIAGEVIPAGRYVVSLVGAANRDPQQFADPDRLDIARRDGASLAFGKGIHHCLGYGLAKLEGEVAFSALLERVSAIELRAPAPQWQANASIRGLETLPVSVKRR